MEIINVLDFSEVPGLRHCDISDNSGEEFYHKMLNRAFKEAFEKGKILEVNLDNTDAYASSFLDEAFGNLVYDFTLANVEKGIKIISEEEPHWIEMIEKETFPQWEQRRNLKKSPKVTEDHEPWFRLIGDKIVKEKWENPSV